MKRLALTVCLLLAGAAMAEGQQTAREYPILGQLETRDYRVVMYVGEEGPLYTIRTRRGDELVVLASAEQLRSSHPELHQLVESLVANLHGRGASFVDGQPQ